VARPPASESEHAGTPSFSPLAADYHSALLVVLDGLGVGDGEAGADTLGHVAGLRPLSVPNLAAMGLAEFDTLQFPFNFVEQEPLAKLFPAALERGMGIIAMKPLGGGLLDRADLCFRFLQQYPEVVPIPGIQAIGEMDEIVGYYKDRRPLTRKDREEIEGIRNQLGGRFCRRCEYCLPCEQGVQIPKILFVKPQVKRFSAKQLLSMSKASVETAEKCVDCGECVEKCPYHLPIPEMLKENVEIFRKFQDEHGAG